MKFDAVEWPWEGEPRIIMSTSEETGLFEIGIGEHTSVGKVLEICGVSIAYARELEAGNQDVLAKYVSPDEEHADTFNLQNRVLVRVSNEEGRSPWNEGIVREYVP